MNEERIKRANALANEAFDLYRKVKTLRIEEEHSIENDICYKDIISSLELAEDNLYDAYASLKFFK